MNDVSPKGEYREQLGIVTAAFYQVVEKDKSSMASQPHFATRLGPAGTGKIEPYEGNKGPGNLIGEAPINIHYGFKNQRDPAHE